MKKSFLLLTLLIVVALSSFKLFTSTDIDKNLVGIWKGFEIYKQYEVVEKHWIVQRYKDGTYTIMFTAKQNCEIQTFTEKGKWWVKNNTFYEQEENSENVESYTYTITDDLVVHFKSTTTEYEFDDYRLD